MQIRPKGFLIFLLFILAPATLHADWSKDELAGAASAFFLMVVLFLSVVVVNVIGVANGISVKTGKRSGIIRLGIVVNSIVGAFLAWVIVKSLLAGSGNRLSSLLIMLLLSVSLIIFYFGVLKKRKRQ